MSLLTGLLLPKWSLAPLLFILNTEPMYFYSNLDEIMSPSAGKSPLAFHLIQTKAKILTMTNNTPRSRPLLPAWCHRLPSLLLTLFQPHWSPCHSSSMLKVPWPWGHCKGRSPDLQHTPYRCLSGLVHCIFSKLCWNVTFLVITSLTFTPELTVS